MGAFVAAPAIAKALLAVTAAATVGTVAAQRKAAGARSVELEVAQRQEASAARDREVLRKRRLHAILGSQRAAAAASGLAMSGSVANISLTDARRASEESLIDDVNTRARIDALKRNRSTISRMSRLRTSTTILGAAERVLAR